MRKIAVSGTYSTGKTTTSYALSLLTGIPRTHAKTMREILPVILPGKRLEECTPYDLYELGINRFTERVSSEASLHSSGYISDGSVLHEWVYGKARMAIGLNPNDNYLASMHKKMRLLPIAYPLQEISNQYGKLVKEHAKSNYDIYIHLPIEFAIQKDGHRPVNERFRTLSETFLIETLEELKIPYITAKGTLEERLSIIISQLNLNPIISIDTAISKALEETKLRNQIEIEYSNNLKNKQHHV